MKSRNIIIICIVILVIALLVIKTMYDAGQFKKIISHCDCKCTTIGEIPGPEDITIFQQGGVAFISSDDRRSTMMGKNTQGAIYEYDIMKKNPKLVNLTGDFKKDFHPHGINLYLGVNGEVLLFVVNHCKDVHSIEIFEYKKTKLVHRQSISHPLMHSPNDVLAVGPRSFYVTNDHGSISGFTRTLEDYLQLKQSYVLYYDGKGMRIVAEDLGYANGINISKDGKTVYVAETTGKAICLFSRDMQSAALTPDFKIHTNTGVDNIEIDDSGRLWVGAHPKMLAFVKHAGDSKALSPSQILRINIQNKSKYSIDDVYMNDGAEISASSVAAPLKGGFIIGQVFNNHIVVCDFTK